VLEGTIELAAMRAWPAFHEERLGGWMLRFADGFTKRANSATLLEPTLLDAERDVAACEARFAARDLPCVFRLPSFSTPPALDAMLDARGYRTADASLTLHRPIDGTARAPASGVRPASVEDWFAAYCRLRATTVQKEATHLRLLRSIQPPCFFATVGERDGIVACGLGVADGGLVGLFDLFTAPSHRGRGIGRALVSEILRWGHRNGAGAAYLQVVEANQAARRLYQSLGFSELYGYWYRVPSLAAHAAPSRGG
jgi:GNAT superfamily N-acetyltransferase